MFGTRCLLPLRVLAAWLLDDPSCPAAARRAFSAMAFAAFVALVIVGVAHHQIWRDEARALTIALEPTRWWGIAAALENEGHPALWHLLLRLAHGVVASPKVLQAVTLPIGIGAAALLFCRAPLPTWWRVAFLFGWVPLFEGPVLCRNYGISMLLLYAFCIFVAGASLRPLLAASMLALLANTNAYGTMMAGGLALFLAVECVRRKSPARVVATVLLVAGAGIALCAWTTWPTAESKLVATANSALSDVWLTGLRAMMGFSTNTGTLFGFAPLAWPVVLLTVVATLCLPHLALAVLAVFGAAAWFMRGVYGAGAHHLGMLFVFLAAVTWIRAAHVGVTTRPVRVAWRALLFGVWPLLLLFQGYRGLREIHHEMEYTKTSAPELARLLERGDLAGAVLVGEPDYYLDAMPYYGDNRIFIAREGRFGRRVSWTTANQRDLDLGQLLAAARALPRDGRAPVLLVIGHPISLDRPEGDVIHGYGDRFRWTAAQHEAFLAATEHVASLPARLGRFRGDERYEVYRLRE